ncbi:hypothetical protein RCL_jg5226.t1 [Rhizophagus clarus]|uniref:Uncharacterized protein n=1 Tax=Rhizophagus clarus TaxID=94130 RepID=A0A8H3QT86_9GLOM|nr:hypothetical protein RCL_jg5226.t1 [Rhizophagus clarus]
MQRKETGTSTGTHRQCESSREGSLYSGYLSHRRYPIRSMSNIRLKMARYVQEKPWIPGRALKHSSCFISTA